jgi:hypothetical protein
MKSAITCIVASLAYLSAGARTVIENGPATSTKLATHVVKVIIDSDRKLRSGEADCGSEYSAHVLAKEKGYIAIGQRISFGFLTGLEIGRTYRIYLLDDPHGERSVELMRERASQLRDVDALISACANLQTSGLTFFRADKMRTTK